MLGSPHIAADRARPLRRPRYPTARLGSLALLLTVAVLAGCDTPREAAPETTRLTMWAHAGQPPEEAALRTLVAGFRTSHPHITVRLTVVPHQDDYNDKLHAGIASGHLPDLFDLDGPNAASMAYQGALAPLDHLLSPEARSRMLPSLVAQGTWREHLWAVGAFDSGLAMWADRSQLVRAGVRIPEGPDDAWTATEMSRALAALAAHDADHKVIDLGLNAIATEWATFAFAPMVYSAGAMLIDPNTGRATGTLDSPAAVGALRAIVGWERYADLNADGKAFTSRRVALSWNGHWRYPEYSAALGSDLALVPLPNLGLGTKSGQGSWAWAIGAHSTKKAAAASLLDWLTNDAGATAMANANGAVPGTRKALARSALVGPGKPLHLFGDQLSRACGTGPVSKDCVTVARPVTPAYPTVTAAFSTAVLLALQGTDPHTALSTAARTIDENLELNHGYTRPLSSN